MTVDTRTVDVNVDRFDARYDDLASTKNTENRRKPTPQGNKQKFTQRGQRQRQQFQKGKRETEFERLQRIQLEKARSAQLKVMIPRRDHRRRAGHPPEAERRQGRCQVHADGRDARHLRRR